MAGGASDLFVPDETYSIMFAAGAAGMPLQGCSRALLTLGLGSCDQGLMDIVPRDLSDEVDEWIFTEVQKMDESGTKQSDSTTSLRLKFPCLGGKECQVASAWLEVPPSIDLDTDEEELVLMVLKLTGLRPAETLTPSRIHRQASRKKKQKKVHSSLLFGGPVLSTVAEGDETEESDGIDGYFQS
jgi:hypothetical protein